MAAEARIYKIATIPQPDGEDSAYDAPTKVGALPIQQVSRLFAEAERVERADSEPPVSGVRVATPVAFAPPPTVDEDEHYELDPTHLIEVEPSPAFRAAQALPPITFADFTQEKAPRFGKAEIAVAVSAALAFAGVVSLCVSFLL